MKCYRCHRELGTEDYEEGLCGVCKNGYEVYYETFNNGSYNYKCICGGEFNTPAIDAIGSSGTGNQRCPFCGKRMEGLK